MVSITFWCNWTDHEQLLSKKQFYNGRDRSWLHFRTACKIPPYENFHTLFEKRGTCWLIDWSAEKMISKRVRRVTWKTFKVLFFIRLQKALLNRFVGTARSFRTVAEKMKTWDFNLAWFKKVPQDVRIRGKRRLPHSVKLPWAKWQQWFSSQ